MKNTQGEKVSTIVFAGLEMGAVLTAIFHPFAPLLIGSLLVLIASFFYYSQALLILLANIGMVKGGLIEIITLPTILDLTVVVSGLILIVLIWKLFDSKIRVQFLKNQNILFTYLVWVTWMICASIYAPRLDWALIKSLRFALFNTTLFIGPLVLIYSISSSRSLLKIFLFVGFAGAIVMTANIIYLLLTGFTGLTTRLTFLSGEPIQTGRIMSVGATMTGLAGFAGEKIKPFWVVVMIVFLIAALSTGSRGPVLSIFLTLFFLGVLLKGKIRKRTFTLITVIIIAIGLYLKLGPENLTARFNIFAAGELVMTRKGLVVFNTITHRWQLWGSAIGLWLKDVRHFLIGSGPAGYAALFPWRDFRYPHNLPLEVICEFGLIGLLVFLGHIGITAKEIFTRFRLNYSKEELLWFGGLVTIFFSSMFSGDINDNRLLWFFMGGLIATMRLSTKKKESNNSFTKNSSH